MADTPAFASSEILPLFPTLVWRFRLPEDATRRVNEAVLAKGQQVAGDLIDATHGEFMQTHQKLHLDPDMAELTEHITSAGRAVMQFLALSQHPFVVSGLWINIGRPGATHKPHRHPNNFLSGTYYARTPEGASSITFFDPRSEAGLMFPQPSRLHKDNSGKLTLSVAPGDLMLWYSWFKHQVPPNDSDEDRYTASFNLMFSDFTERHSPPMKQNVVDSLGNGPK